MPAAAGWTLDRDAVEAVVALASSAPSLHNTQPWQWRLQQGVLDLRADRSRQLRVADPDGHSLHVSCGAAAELTQLALAAQGWAVDASLLSDPADPDLLARFHPTSRGEPNAEAAQRSEAASRRRSERRVFGPRPVSPQEIERLRDAAPAAFRFSEATPASRSSCPQQAS